MAKRFIPPFFSHDYNSRTDEKIIKMMSKMKWEGYGIYWAIVEKLYDNDGEIENDCESIAYDLRTHSEIIKELIENYDLFYIENNKIRSYSVDYRIALRMEKSQKAKDSAMQRHYSNANAMRTHSEGNAIKERKEKKKKEKKVNTSIPAKVPEEVSKPVNWDNCKTKNQLLMKFYVSEYLPELYQGYTQKEYKAFMARNGKAISGILAQCRDNVSMAIKVIKNAGFYFSKKGMDWSLYAVDRNCSDYVNDIKKGEKQNA